MAPTTRRTNGHVRRPPIRQAIPKDVLVELSLSHNKACMFCGQKEISELLYGQLYQLNDVIVHYFCILLSSRAVQNGADRDGIWGFLLKDIKAELLRGSREPCYYCKLPGATISCCGIKCRKIFHLPCGLQNGSMHQYFQSFKSFCQQHRITQTVDLNQLQTSIPRPCPICTEETPPTPLPTTIWAPCCKHNAWFHRKCIQELALSAGYFFKCPLCNNVDTFKSRMLTLGIYIPSRDASWETVPNAYAELLVRPTSCDAETCLCPHQEKRNFHEETGSWEIILCYACGSSGTHVLCSTLKCEEHWFCIRCRNIAGPLSSKRKRIEAPVSTTTSNDDRSSNIISLRRANARDVSHTMGIRESTRLNTSKEMRPNRNLVMSNLRNGRSINNSLRSSMPSSTMPERIVDSIVISDDDNDSDDSDVQVISVSQLMPRPIPVSPPRQLIISDIKSICTSQSVSELPIGNVVSTTIHHVRNLNQYPLFESIDLTMSDEETE